MPKTTTKPLLTWEAALERYDTALRARRSAPSTLKVVHYMLRTLADHMKTRRCQSPALVTLDDLRSFQCDLLSGSAARRGRPLAAKTVASVTTTLRGFFGFLEEEAVLRDSPARRLESPHVPPHTPGAVLTVAEVKRLLAACEETTALGVRDRAAFELLYATGLRVGELAALDLGDLDHHEREVAVRHGKGDKGRIVPLARSAYESLLGYVERARPALTKKHRDGASALFLSCRGRRVTSETIQDSLAAVARRAKIGKTVTPHTLRRTFATHLMKAGVSVRHIQLLLGHERLNTTALYLRLSAEEIRREVLLHHPRERFEV